MTSDLKKFELNVFVYQVMLFEFHIIASTFYHDYLANGLDSNMIRLEINIYHIIIWFNRGVAYVVCSEYHLGFALYILSHLNWNTKKQNTMIGLHVPS